MTRVRSLLLAAGVALTMLSACSVEETLPLPDCASGGSGLIVAQSVPTAEFIPCVWGLPIGWEVDTIVVNQDGLRLRLDSDRAGEGAAILNFRPTCNVAGTEPGPSRFDGVRRFDLVDAGREAWTARQYHVFDGGCVWWDLRFQEGTPDPLANELTSRLDLTSRELYNANIRETFIDEEL